MKAIYLDNTEGQLYPTKQDRSAWSRCNYSLGAVGSTAEDTESLDTTIGDQRQLHVCEGAGVLATSSEFSTLVHVLSIGLAELVAAKQGDPIRMIMRWHLTGRHAALEQAVHPHGAGEVTAEILGVDDNLGNRAGQTQLEDGPVSVAWDARPRGLPAVAHVLAPAGKYQVRDGRVVLIGCRQGQAAQERGGEFLDGGFSGVDVLGSRGRDRMAVETETGEPAIGVHQQTDMGVGLGVGGVVVVEFPGATLRRSAGLRG